MMPPPARHFLMPCYVIIIALLLTMALAIRAMMLPPPLRCSCHTPRYSLLLRYCCLRQRLRCRLRYCFATPLIAICFSLMLALLTPPNALSDAYFPRYAILITPCHAIATLRCFSVIYYLRLLLPLHTDGVSPYAHDGYCHTLALQRYAIIAYAPLFCQMPLPRYCQPIPC